MHGDPRMGALLRALRQAADLSLGAVAARIGCAPSLICQVETGQRAARRWLLECLDTVYDTGGTLQTLTAVSIHGTTTSLELIVQLPKDNRRVVVPRRDVMLSLALGVLTDPLRPLLHPGPTTPEATAQILARYEQSLASLVRMARSARPSLVIDALVGNVIVLEGVRQSCPHRYREATAVLQARHAESLSWMSEEAGDVRDATFWTDRAAQWAMGAHWHAMVAYTCVRRSMIALTFGDTGPQAVRHAALALEMPQVPSHVRALAAKQMAYGYALAGQADDSARALDLTARLMTRTEEEAQEPPVGQRSVLDDDLHAIFQGTCDVYLGRGRSPIEMLTPHLKEVARQSPRTHAITRAKIARAHIDAGDPTAACELIMDAANETEAVGSQTARAELRRAAPALRRWARNDDVAQVLHRLTELSEP